MEFDGSLRSAFRIINETRVQLEQERQVMRLEELEELLRAVADAARRSKKNAMKRLAEESAGQLTIEGIE